MGTSIKKIKCLACGSSLKPEEHGGDFCLDCLYEFTDKWLVRLYSKAFKREVL